MFQRLISRILRNINNECACTNIVLSLEIPWQLCASPVLIINNLHVASTLYW